MNEVASKPIRSPSYPSMSLRDAVDAVAKIEGQYRASPVDRTVAAKLIGFTTLSGPANKALAALASYGLLERAGKGETRVTSRARAALHANSDKERIDNLLAAASEPHLFQELRERFEGVPIPPEDGVVTYLNRQGFNPSAVRPAAKAFLQTMAYVEELSASESHGNQSSEDAELEAPGGGSDATYGGARVGDIVQWESQGALQFPKPLRVRMISDDGQWVAVEGSRTGIPMSEVIVDTPARQTNTPPVFEFDQPKRSDHDTGAQEWFRARVGPGKQVVILFEGAEDINAREIGKLIDVLEAQKLALEDE